MRNLAAPMPAMAEEPNTLLYRCTKRLEMDSRLACSAAGSKKAERLSLDARPDAPSEIPEGLNIDWNARYTFAELEAQLSQMAEQYPDITDLYSIGTTWQERDLWCLEITNKAIPAEEKTGIGVFIRFSSFVLCFRICRTRMSKMSSMQYLKSLSVACARNVKPLSSVVTSTLKQSSLT